jgi:hypothetical protein
VSLVEQPVAENRFALAFDGRSAFAQTKIRFSKQRPLTIEVDFRPNINTRGSVVSNANNGGIGIGLENGFAYASMHDGQGYVFVKSKRRVPNGERVFVTAVFEQTSITLFVDGVLQGSKNLEHRRKPSRFPLMIGADPDAKGKPQHFFNGEIYRARLTEFPLYKKDFKVPQEFKTHRKTLATFAFSNGLGTRLSDSSGRRKHAVVHNAKWITID